MKKLLSLSLVFICMNVHAIDESVLSKKDFNDLSQEERYSYMQIEERIVEEIEPEAFWLKKSEKLNAKSIGSIIMTADKLIALGQKVWKIVEAGKPVINQNFKAPISIIPTTGDVNATFNSMSDWKMPTVKSFRVSYKNGFRKTVVSFVYTVVFQYGGKYEGKGAYITGLFVTASNVNVSWGFSFDASSEVMSISNQGSMDSPIASSVLNVKYKVSSPLKAIDQSDIFFVNGLGQIKSMTPRL